MRHEEICWKQSLEKCLHTGVYCLFLLFGTLGPPYEESTTTLTHRWENTGCREIVLTGAHSGHPATTVLSTDNREKPNVEKDHKKCPPNPQNCTCAKPLNFGVVYYTAVADSCDLCSHFSNESKPTTHFKFQSTQRV